MGIKVLLVDDEVDFVEMMSQRLEIRDMDVETALSGDEALKYIERKQIDVMLLDVQMPGRDGLETLKETKKRKPLVRVLMLTGHATVEIAIQGMKLGADDFLIKPTDTEELIKKIGAAYEQKKIQEDRIRQAEIENITKRRGW